MYTDDDRYRLWKTSIGDPVEEMTKFCMMFATALSAILNAGKVVNVSRMVSFLLDPIYRSGLGFQPSEMRNMTSEMFEKEIRFVLQTHRCRDDYSILEYVQQPGGAIELSIACRGYSLLIPIMTEPSKYKTRLSADVNLDAKTSQVALAEKAVRVSNNLYQGYIWEKEDTTGPHGYEWHPVK